MTTETLPLPPVEAPPGNCLPLPGTYAVQPGRCIIELTARFGPLVTLRSRLAPSKATLTVDPQHAAHSSLRLDADSRSVRTDRPLANTRMRGRYGLYARRYPRLRFTSERIEQIADDRLSILGDLHLRGVACSVQLSARVVNPAQDRFLLVATADLPYRPLRRATGFTLPPLTPARCLRLLIAAEFT